MWKPNLDCEVDLDAMALSPTREIIYRVAGDRQLTLRVFSPENLRPGDRVPCFVTIHGGGWSSGDPRRFYPHANHFARLGMVGISLQYSLISKTDEAPFPCVKDGRSAVRFLRANAEMLQIDPDKIIVSGGSAGGHVAVGTALFDGIDAEGDDTSVSCVPNALVLYYPVIDTSEEGYGNARLNEHWRDLSPLHNVKPNLPPSILFHGTADTVTPFIGAKRFHAAMLRAGNRCDFIVEEGGIHGYFLYKRALFARAMLQTESFLRSLGYLASPQPF